MTLARCSPSERRVFYFWNIPLYQWLVQAAADFSAARSLDQGKPCPRIPEMATNSDDEVHD